MNITSKDNTRIAYETFGSGPVVILVDGAMCFRASGPMLPLADELKKDFTVYAYDRRGRGESGDEQPYAVEREIEDIEALIDQAGGQAYLYGISSGAVLALKAAGALGTKVKALALYEPPLVLDAEEQADTLHFSTAVQAALKKGDKDAAATLFMGRVAKVLQMPDEMLEGMRHSPMWAGMVALAPTIGYDNAVMQNGSIPSEAKNLRLPALVLAGGASPENMQAATEALAQAIPGATYKLLDGQTHEVKPDILAPVLLEFFRGKA